MRPPSLIPAIDEMPDSWCGEKLPPSLENLAAFVSPVALDTLSLSLFRLVC